MRSKLTGFALSRIRIGTFCFDQRAAIGQTFRIGVLIFGSAAAYTTRIDAFRQAYETTDVGNQNHCRLEIHRLIYLWSTVKTNRTKATGIVKP